MTYLEEISDKEEWGGWKIVSEMLDNPDKHGLYQTSECYKKLYEFVMDQKTKARNEVCDKLLAEGHGGGNFRRLILSLKK